jgi:cystathionine beta-synthase
MSTALPEVDEKLPLKKLSYYFNEKIPAVIAIDKAGNRHIITKYDIVQAMG